MKTDKTIEELVALGYRIYSKKPGKDARKFAAARERSRRTDLRYSGTLDIKTKNALYARELYLNLHNVDTDSPTYETRRGAFFRFNLEAMRNWRMQYKYRWPRLPEKTYPRMQLCLYEFGYDEGKNWSAEIGMGAGHRPLWLEGVLDKLDALCIAKLEYDAKRGKWPKIAIVGDFGSPFLQGEQLATDMLKHRDRIEVQTTRFYHSFPLFDGFSYFGDAARDTAASIRSLAVYFDRTAPQPVETHKEKQKDRHGRPVYRGYFKGAARRKY
jgi:hypothetical protein